MSDNYTDWYPSLYGEGDDDDPPPPSGGSGGYSDSYDDTYDDEVGYGAPGGYTDTYDSDYTDITSPPTGTDHEVDVEFSGSAVTGVSSEIDAGDDVSATISATGDLSATATLVPLGNIVDADGAVLGATGAVSLASQPTTVATGSDIDAGVAVFGATGATYAAASRPVGVPRRIHVVSPTADVVAALRASTIHVWRVVDILNPDGTLWASEVPFESGSVNVDMSRAERRTLDMVLDNFDRSLTPNPDGLWYDKLIRVRRGVEVQGDRYEFDLGLFAIDQCGRAGDTLGTGTSITGRDLSKWMVNDKTEAALTFKKGTKITDIVRALVLNAGLTNVLLPISDERLAVDASYDADTPRWDIAAQVCLEFNYDFYFGADGVPRMTRKVDPLLDPTVIVIGESNGTAIKFGRSTSDSELRNHVVVTSTSSNGTLPVWASVENNEPSSPTRVGRIGRRTKRIESALATTKQQCLDLARSILSVSGLEQMEVSFESLNFPWLDVGNIITVDDPEALAGDPRRFLLTSLTVPLNLAPMQGTAKRITVVGMDYSTSEDVPEPVDLIWGDEVAA